MQQFDFFAASALGHSKIPLGGILIPLMRSPRTKCMASALLLFRCV